MSLTLIELVRQALEEIDNELREEGVEIFKRPLHALTKLGKKFPQLNGMSILPIENPRSELEAVPGEVQTWYTSRYGERLKFDQSIGYYPLLIRGDPWRARLPRCYGNIQFSWYMDFSTSCAKSEVNIPTKIEGLTQDLASSLKDQEILDIGSEYVWALNALTSLSSSKLGGLLEAALNDYNSAVENIFAKNPHDGQCKWSALQFAEKSLKQRLADLGVKPKQTHDLQKLSDELLSHGVTIDRNLIAKVQCQASVRYGEAKVTREEAVKAVQSALKIYTTVFPPSAFEFANQFPT